MLKTLSSFRDPAGYVFTDKGIYKRAVTVHGEVDYNQLMTTGLYDNLVKDGLLVAHTEEPVSERSSDIRKILVPQQINHISYPYEWSFGQLRDAALLTLEIEKRAIQYGMSLKDASAFNVQFRGPNPVFIDTLSFGLNDGGPWSAYSQFCRHFLGPLLLMSRVSPSFNQYLKTALDGFPLELTASLLPLSAFLNFGTFIHIYLHARSQERYSGRAKSQSEKAAVARRTSSDPKPGFVDSLNGLVRGISLGKFHTEWMHYYRDASHYSTAAETSKKQTIARILDDLKPNIVYDLGGNIGEYSRLVTQRGIDCLCFDIDPLCVHYNYERARKESDRHMLPLMMDLSNPSPALGFNLTERTSMPERSKADLLMALAILHHLRITANAPFDLIATFLARLGHKLLIEYVPKSDVMVQVLLRNRADTFIDYTEDRFLSAFAKHFRVEQSLPVADTSRTLYLFTRI